MKSAKTDRWAERRASLMRLSAKFAPLSEQEEIADILLTWSDFVIRLRGLDATQIKRTDAKERLERHVEYARTLQSDLRDPWFYRMIQGAIGSDPDLDPDNSDILEKLENLAKRAELHLQNVRDGKGSDRLVPMRAGDAGDYTNAETIVAMIIVILWEIYKPSPFKASSSTSSDLAHELWLACDGAGKEGSWIRSFQDVAKIRATEIDARGANMSKRYFVHIEGMFRGRLTQMRQKTAILF